MKIGITKLISENIAPTDAKNLAIYDGDKKVCAVDIARIKPTLGTPLYSFCALSDVHINQETANEDFQRALTFVENSDCLFTCISGDLVINGTESELNDYKRIVDTHSPTKPVYAITGNHENYSTVSKDFLQDYTGHPLYYSFTQGNDVFIMLGHYGGYGGDGIGWQPSEMFSQAEIQWFYETLEANRNKRCFVFIHPLPMEHNVGNPCGLYTTAPIFRTNQELGIKVINLLKHYKNTILFHGHSHFRLKMQEVDTKANYSSAFGYKSVHIPSLASPRGTIDETTGGATGATIYAESEGYIVDVYGDCIVLNGRDFIDNEADGHDIPIARYKIDTSIVNVESKPKEYFGIS